MNPLREQIARLIYESVEGDIHDITFGWDSASDWDRGEFLNVADKILKLMSDRAS